MRYGIISFLLGSLLVSGLFVFSWFWVPHTAPIEVTSWEAEVRTKGLNPRPAEETIAAYVDPATGEIPSGIRRSELEYARTLPQKEVFLERVDTEPVFRWAEAGPTNLSGRVRAIGVDVANPGTVITGGTAGGIWKSTNDGETWHMMSTPGQHMSITALAQDTRAGQTHVWYAGGGEIRGGTTSSDRGFRAIYSGIGLYKSEDNGDTWDLVEFGQDPKPIPSGSFNSAPSVFDWVHRIVVTKTEGAVLVANSGDGIYRSTDGGVTFRLVLGEKGAHRWNDISMAPSGRLVAALSKERHNTSLGTGGGVYVSDDEGASWRRITPTTLPRAISRSLIRIAPSDPSIAYLLTTTRQLKSNGREDVRFYKIDLDTGAISDRSANLPNFNGTPSLGASLHFFGTFCMAMAVHPKDPNVIIVGGTSLFRTLNGYTTPASQLQTIGGYLNAITGTVKFNHYVDQHRVLFDPHNPDKLWSTNDGGVFVTTNIRDSFVDFTSRQKGLNLSQLYNIAISDQAGDPRILTAAQDNGSPYIIDQRGDPSASDAFGPAWKVMFGDGADGYLGARFTFTVQQLAEMRRHRYLDGEGLQLEDGRNLSLMRPPISNSVRFINRFAVEPTEEKVLIVPDGERLWRNNDIDATAQNANWQRLPDLAVPPGQGYSIFALAWSREPAHRLYYSATSWSTSPKIYRLDNANTATSGAEDISIPSVPTNGFVHEIAVNPLNADEIVVALSNYYMDGLWHSADGGRTYSSIEGNLLGTRDLPGPSIRTATILPITTLGKTVYFVGTSIGLFSTTALDGENTVWTQEAVETIGSALVERVVSRVSDYRVAVATVGRGAFIGDVDPASIVSNEGEEELPQRLSVGQNYPNPFHKQTTIPFELGADARVWIEVFDVSGRLVQTILNGHARRAGSHTVTYVPKRLSGGVYLVRIQTHSLTQQQRLVQATKQIQYIK